MGPGDASEGGGGVRLCGGDVAEKSKRWWYHGCLQQTLHVLMTWVAAQKKSPFCLAWWLLTVYVQIINIAA